MQNAIKLKPILIRKGKLGRNGYPNLYKCPYCDNTFTSSACNIENGHKASCGCMSDEFRKANRGKHRLSVKEKRLYNSWSHMRDRCNNPNNKRAKHYFEKGITVCEEWNDFKKFYDWAITNGYNEHLWLDRIDFNDSYYPENCRWITSQVSGQNTSKMMKVETVKQIKFAALLGFKASDIMIMTGYHRNTINSILIGQTWSNILL